VTTPVPYPASGAERTEWIRTARGERNSTDPSRPNGFFIEQERTITGEIENAATVFLNNRECAWHCVMCDLWRGTGTARAPPGMIVDQLDYALKRLGPATVLKLYNSGSFFDAGSVPREDWPQIARLCRAFKKVVIECHPRLMGNRALEFASLLSAQLEIAFGLETAHPEALEKINKRITLADFQKAVQLATKSGIHARTFLLVHPPFIPRDKQAHWLRESICRAFDAGSNIVSLIPTRLGNGAMEQLAALGEFQPPPLSALEEGLDFGVSLRSGNVFADTWDLKLFCRCKRCFEPRVERLKRMNLFQIIDPGITCSCP
jgi:radical SAM enzyme (TIGR01210 family)